LKLKYRGIRVGALALALAAGAAFGGYALAADSVVTMTPTGPQPPTVTVNLGDKLTWSNDGSANYVIASMRLGIASPAIPPGGSFEYVVTRSGTFGYQQQGADRRSRFDGTLVVLRSGTVTLSTRREFVAYSSQVMLAGTTTLPGFPVTIEHKPVRERSWLPLGTLTPAADGTFSITIKPPIGATYRARVLGNELVSKPLALAVVPRVKIRSSARKIPGGRTVTLTVRVVPAAGANSVDIMRYDRMRKQWRRVTTRPLSAKGVATYRWSVPYGRTLLRGWLKRKNLEAGYAESFSARILVQGTGKPPEAENRPNRTGPKDTRRS
jgi:plastocyanin